MEGNDLKTQRIGLLILLFLCAVLFTSCATSTSSAPSRIPLNIEAIPHISSTDVFIGFGDDEINPSSTFRLSKYTMGGLIPALIDVLSSNSQAKERINPVEVREVLEGNKGKQEFTEKMKLILQEVKWLKVKEVSLANSASNNMYDVYYSLSKASSVLFITTYYFFSEDFSTLKIACSIKLFPKDEHLKSFAFSWSENKENSIRDENCIYKTIIELEKPLGKEVVDREAAILLWSNNNASLLRETINSGTSEIAQMIATDLNALANKGFASLDRGELYRSQ
jgi:hypothetical protein